MSEIQSLQLEQLPQLRSQTVAIAGKLKTLWRSLSIDDTGNSENLFTQNLGDGGDSYIVETLINDVATLHKALSEVEPQSNLTVKTKDTLKHTLFCLVDDHGSHEVLERLLEIYQFQSNREILESDRKVLKDMVNHLCNAQVRAESLSDRFDIS